MSPANTAATAYIPPSTRKCFKSAMSFFMSAMSAEFCATYDSKVLVADVAGVSISNELTGLFVNPLLCTLDETIRLFHEYEIDLD